jgi:hypothetical protein
MWAYRIVTRSCCLRFGAVELIDDDGIAHICELYVLIDKILGNS